MKKIQFIVITFVFLFMQPYLAVAEESADYQSKAAAEINETARRVKAAFAEADIDTILLYHHKDVEKFLSWDNIQIGHTDMRKALEGLLSTVTLEFTGPKELESFTASSDTATVINRFAIRAISKQDGSEAWRYSGRTMLLYVRNGESPTGWQTLREMIMEAPQQ